MKRTVKNLPEVKKLVSGKARVQIQIFQTSKPVFLTTTLIFPMELLSLCRSKSSSTITLDFARKANSQDPSPEVLKPETMRMECSN